jgi:hypothetical protein
VLGRARPALILKMKGTLFGGIAIAAVPKLRTSQILGLPGEEESAAARNSTEKDLTSSKNFNPPAHGASTARNNTAKRGVSQRARGQSHLICLAEACRVEP